MHWSRLKSNVEAFFAPSVRGRVELRAASYRKAHDDDGRGYITVDGNEVWNMCYFRFRKTERQRMDAIAESNPSQTRVQSLACAELASEGVFSQDGYYRTLFMYCNANIEASLESPNVLTRSLAVLDYRVGKRRLRSMNISAEHPMVQYFYNLRCQAEGIVRTVADAQ